MSKIQAWILLASIVVTVWPIISMAIFDDSCQRGFWRAYKDHLFGWMIMFGICFVICAAVVGVVSSLEVLTQ